MKGFLQTWFLESDVVTVFMRFGGWQKNGRQMDSDQYKAMRGRGRRQGGEGRGRGYRGAD